MEHELDRQAIWAHQYFPVSRLLSCFAQKVIDSPLDSGGLHFCFINRRHLHHFRSYVYAHSGHTQHFSELLRSECCLQKKSYWTCYIMLIALLLGLLNQLSFLRVRYTQSWVDLHVRSWFDSWHAKLTYATTSHACISVIPWLACTWLCTLTSWHFTCPWFCSFAHVKHCTCLAEQCSSAAVTSSKRFLVF